MHGVTMKKKSRVGRCMNSAEYQISKEMSEYELQKMRIFAQIKKNCFINISFKFIKE